MPSRETGTRRTRTSGALAFSGAPSSSVIGDVFDFGVELARRRFLPTDPGTNGGTFPGPEGGFAEECPTGFRFDGKKCVKRGFEGAIERMLPGGETGVLPTTGFGEAVVGGFGIAALRPRQTGTVITARGEVRPTLGCPRGAVLGTDNLCYNKGSITRSQRKWPPASRPPVSAADAKAIRKANSSRERVKKLAQSTGLFVANSRPRPKQRAKGKC